MQQNKLENTKSIEEIRKLISTSYTGYDSNYILRLADNEIKNIKSKKEFSSDTNYYKAMTLFEFDKGILLLNAVSNLHKVFAVEFSKNIQAEYDCKTPSEKSVAETVALNFVRILEIQRRITNALEDTKNRYDLQYLAILSKELDRAERHYLTSLQTLRALHSPSFEVNIKTNTAVIGQNQAVQVKNA